MVLFYVHTAGDEEVACRRDETVDVSYHLSSHGTELFLRFRRRGESF